MLDFADDNFPALLPFTTLRRARGHEGRVARRLRAIALVATGFPPRDRKRYVMLDEHLGTESVQRVQLALKRHEYVGQWSDEDLGWVRQYDVEALRDELWPRLLERGYAKPTDALDAFCERLGNRPAYLRPGIRIRRTWPGELAEDLDDRDALVPEVRQAIKHVLAVLDEPGLNDAG